MGISYRKDDDLAFLQYCTEEDLEQLGRFIIYDKDGEERIVSEIIASPEFTAHSGKPDQWRLSWQLVAGELQHFGGDSVVNLFRGNGVTYREILCDVCAKLKVKFDKKAKAYDIESALIDKLIKKAWEGMNKSERLDAFGGLDLPDMAELTLENILLLTQSRGLGAVAVATWLAYSARLAFTPFSITGVGAAGVSSFIAQRGGSALAGPFAALVIAIPMLSGTAYRVTVPAVIQIAYMRRKYEIKEPF